MANLKITLVKSLNGRIQKHKANAAALGLKKIGDSTVQPDNPCTLSLIHIYQKRSLFLMERAPFFVSLFSLRR